MLISLTLYWVLEMQILLQFLHCCALKKVYCCLSSRSIRRNMTKVPSKGDGISTACAECCSSEEDYGSWNQTLVYKRLSHGKCAILLLNHDYSITKSLQACYWTLNRFLLSTICSTDRFQWHAYTIFRESYTWRWAFRVHNAGHMLSFATFSRVTGTNLWLMSLHSITEPLVWIIIWPEWGIRSADSVKCAWTPPHSVYDSLEFCY